MLCCAQHSLMFDSAIPGVQPARFLSVHGDSPGNNTGEGCHALLQGFFPTQGLNPGLRHCRWILYHLSHQGGPIYLYLIYICITFIYIYLSTHIHVVFQVIRESLDHTQRLYCMIIMSTGPGNRPSGLSGLSHGLCHFPAVWCFNFLGYYLSFLLC